MLRVVSGGNNVFTLKSSWNCKLDIAGLNGPNTVTRTNTTANVIATWVVGGKDYLTDLRLAPDVTRTSYIAPWLSDLREEDIRTVLELIVIYRDGKNNEIFDLDTAEASLLVGPDARIAILRTEFQDGYHYFDLFVLRPGEIFIKLNVTIEPNSKVLIDKKIVVPGDPAYYTGTCVRVREGVCGGCTMAYGVVK